MSISKILTDVEEVVEAVRREDFYEANAVEVTTLITARSGSNGCVVVG